MDGYGWGVDDYGYSLSLGKREHIEEFLETGVLPDDYTQAERGIAELEWIRAYRIEGGYQDDGGTREGSVERELSNDTAGSECPTVEEPVGEQEAPERDVVPRKKGVSSGRRARVHKDS